MGESIKYRRTKDALFLIDIVWTVVFLCLLQFSRLSVVLKPQQPLPWYLANFFVVFYLAGLPVRFLSGFAVEKQYGLSRQTLGHWFFDELKKFLLSLLFFIVATGGLFLLIDHFPKAWWVFAAFGWLVLTLFLSRILPTLLIPIFYRLQPLKEGPLKERLLSLCRKCAVKILRIDEIAFSKKTHKANAALVGIGKSRRIILGDTLIQNFSDEEIEMVVAHEVGHQVKRHIPKNVAFNFCAVFGGFYFLNQISNTITGGLGARSLTDPAIFPMLALLGFAGGLVLLPLQNAFSRFMENEADRYAVGVIPSRTVFISMIQKLGARNLADAQPSAWMEFLFYDHPSIGRRIKNISRILTAVLFIFSFSGRVAAAEPDRIPGKVHWVVDGDTFQLETGERVRLIGVDTPEYQPWKNRIDPYGREASEYSKKLLSGKKVWLEKDAGEKDRYGRTLAYVYLEDGRFVNRILVEEGFARAKYYPPNGRYYEIFKTAQRAAKKLKKGLWAEKKAFKIVPS